MDTVAKRAEYVAAKADVERQLAGIEIGIKIAKALGFDRLLRRLEAFRDKRKDAVDQLAAAIALIDRQEAAAAQLAAIGYPHFPPEVIPADEYETLLDAQAQFVAFIAQLSPEAAAAILAGVFGQPRPKKT